MVPEVAGVPATVTVAVNDTPWPQTGAATLGDTATVEVSLLTE